MLRLQVIGRLTRDAGVKSFNGTNFMEFSVAVNRKVNGREFTDFIDCTWSADRGSIFPYLLKGKQVFVEGLPRWNCYQSNKDGRYYAGVNLMVDRLELLGDSQQQQQQQPQQNPPQQQAPADPNLPPF